MTGEPLALAGVALVTFAATWAAVAAMRAVSLRRGILDVPNERSLHERPVPRGGGAAFVAAALIAFAMSGAVRGLFTGFGFPLLMFGFAALAVISLYDDVRSVNAGIRLIVQALAAVLAVSAVGVPGGSMVGAALAVIWIVGFTNAYNFMDGIDGIAASQAAVAAAGWATVAWLAGIPGIAAIGTVVAAVSGAFLLHNWPPARIFMGDVGSTFLGYVLAVLVVMAWRIDARLGLAGVLLVWPFVFDATFTLLRRLRRGENVFAAHRTHLYQRLVLSGWTHRSVTTLYAALALLGAACGAMVAQGAFLEVCVSAGIVTFAAVALWVAVTRRELVLSREPAPSAGGS